MNYKVGDVIVFTKDIRTEPANGRKPVIPKMVPCIITKLNKNHVWVMYNKKEHWLRLISERMLPATEAAQILYGDKNV